MRVAYESRTGRDETSGVEAVLDGEIVRFHFTEGYTRSRIPAPELARLRKSDSWASEWVHSPSGKYTLYLNGSVYGTAKTWSGSREKMEAALPEMVETFIELVPRQKQVRLERAERDREARDREIARALQQRRGEARAEQLKRAFEMAATCERVAAVDRFLDGLGDRANDMNERREKQVRLWVKVVREELADVGSVEKFLEKILQRPRWGEWPPLWVPVDAEWLDSDQPD